MKNSALLWELCGQKTKVRTKVDSKTVVDMREKFGVFWNYNEANGRLSGIRHKEEGKLKKGKGGGGKQRRGMQKKEAV